MNAVAYVRISNDPEGKALGVARQEEEIRALAERHGTTIAKVYSDNDVSAMTGVRPEFERLLSDASAGRIGTVYAWASDRLYRRTTDLERIVTALENVEVRTVISGSIDLSTASGKMTARILGAVATGEVERTQERLLAKHRELARAGKRAGGAVPYGWRSPEEGATVRRIIASLLAGDSVASVRRALNAEGVPAPAGGEWSHQGLRSVAMRTANCGVREHRGQRFPAEWEALVSEDEQARVTRLLTDPRRRTNHPERARRHALSGVLECGVEGCTELLRHKAAGGRTACYQCPRGHLSIPAEPVERFVLRVAQEWLDGQGGVRADSSAAYAEALAQRGALEERLAEVADGLRSGTLSVALAGAVEAGLREDLAAVDARLVELDRTAGVERGLVVADLSAERQRVVIGAVMRVVIKPVGRGGWRCPVEERVEVLPPAGGTGPSR